MNLNIDRLQEYLIEYKENKKDKTLLLIRDGLEILVKKLLKTNRIYYNEPFLMEMVVSKILVAIFNGSEIHNIDGYTFLCIKSVIGGLDREKKKKTWLKNWISIDGRNF